MRPGTERAAAESDAQDPGQDHELGALAERVTARLIRDPARRAERLGEIFVLCEQALRTREVVRTDPAACERLAAWVRARLEREHRDPPRSGALGLQVGADARPIEPEAGLTRDPAALELGRRALQRALSLASAGDDQTMLRNLRWYERRLAHVSYEAIARAEQRAAATVRTGVARARKFVLRVVHDLQHGQPAPLDAGGSSPLERLRELWFRQDLEGLGRALDATREALGDDPGWLNLRGLWLADRGLRDDALACYERGLLGADAAPVRTRLLNNLGNLEDDLGHPERAHHYWLRAHRLSPAAPTPLLNLLAAASVARDYASAQHYTAELAALLGSDRLDAAERAYLMSRLRDNPRLAWFRDTDAWRQGPARWLRADAGRPGDLRLLAATAALLLAMLLPGLSRGAPLPGARPDASPPAGLRLLALEADDAPAIRLARGGDSMGKPAVRPVRQNKGGDSMGLRGGPRPRSRPSR